MSVDLHHEPEAFEAPTPQPTNRRPLPNPHRCWRYGYWLTYFIFPLGIGSPIINAYRASLRGESSAPYWTAFWRGYRRSLKVMVIWYSVLTVLAVVGLLFLGHNSGPAATGLGSSQPSVANQLPTHATKPTAPASKAPIQTATVQPTHVYTKTGTPQATTGACRYTETQALLSSKYTKEVGLPSDPAVTPSTGTVNVTVATNQGPLTFTLDRASAPCAVQSFVYNVQHGLYNASSCPRLTTSGIYMLQCGDPSGTGLGGSTYQFKPETNASTSYTAGTVAMANSAGSSNMGAQFFIVTKNSPGIPKNYSVIGHVTGGMTTINKVAKAGSDNSNGAGDGKPITGLSFVSAHVS